MTPYLIAALFGISLGGLGYMLLNALRAGAEAYSGAYSEDTARQFGDIFLFIEPRYVAQIGWAVAGVVFTLVFLVTANFGSLRGVFAGVLLGSILATVALHSPRWLLGVLRRRRLKRFNLQLVDTLISMGNALKAGFSIMQAFESVVREGENPIAQEFDVFLQQTRVGVSFSEALENMEQRVGSEDLTLVVLAIETARKTGGNLTEIFEKISHTIRERLRIENRIRTLTAQGRLQGIVVGAMPVVIGIALTIVDPDLMLPFFRSTFGIAVVVAMTVLITLGAMVIKKIITIDV